MTTKKFGILLGFLFVVSCAVSYTHTMAPVIKDLGDNRSLQAMDRLREVFPDTTGKDRLLYLMEIGNLARYAGYQSVAQKFLLEADRLSDNLRGTDLGQQAQSMITSDLALEFRGADYEKVFINYCLAASYAESGDLEDALVEARRVNEKLKEINSRHTEHPNRYSDDAFVRYFNGVLYEMDGDYDDALISYRLALGVYDSAYAADYNLSSPLQLRADAIRLADKTGFESLFSSFQKKWPKIDWSTTGPSETMGEVVAVVELGNISPREASDFNVYAKDRVYSISLPVIPDFPRRNVIGALSVGGHTANLFLVEDLNGIARKNLEDEAARNVLRAAARLAVKSGLADLGGHVAEQLSDNDDVGSAVGLILSILGAASEQADLRAWLTLPAQIHMVRLQVPPGSWPVRLTVNGRTYAADSVEVQSGETELLFFREDI